MKRKGTNGYRYVRGYRVKDGSERYALWERQNGRARRIGTALSKGEYLRFLFDKIPDWALDYVEEPDNEA